MAIKSDVSDVLNKKMDRVGFLKHLAIAAVALSGIGTALRLMTTVDKKQSRGGVGYGDSAYGGSSKSS